MKLLRSILLLLVAVPVWAGEKEVVLDPSYRHDILQTIPRETMREYRAYTVSFDSADDDNGDGVGDRLAIPQWVAYEMRRFTGDVPKYKRPSAWFTDKELHQRGEAAKTESYHFSRKWRKANPNSPQLGYDRGHLCMKHHASRLGANADWNTHTTLNCIPQKANLNQGAWLDLEMHCEEWADLYGRIWIITGPVFYPDRPRRWLGEEGELKVAIPDACFKIIFKPNKTRTADVLAFIYPQETPRKRGGYDHRLYLTSVRKIEQLTGLQFFTRLRPDTQERLETVTAQELWPTRPLQIANQPE